MLSKGRKVREDPQLKQSFAAFGADPVYKYNPMAGASHNSKAGEDGRKY